MTRYEFDAWANDKVLGFGDSLWHEVTVEMSPDCKPTISCSGRFSLDDVSDLRHDLETYERYSKMYARGIKKVIFNPPATIVFWNDGSKTVVKATNELFDWEKGLAMAYVKKMCGNKGNYYNIFRKHAEDGEIAEMADRERHEEIVEEMSNPIGGFQNLFKETVITAFYNAFRTKDKNLENTVSSRNIAAEIVEEFESLLDKHDIDIPDEDRGDNPNNGARLYGVTYADLLNSIEDILYSALVVVKNNPKLEIVKGVMY